jgi:endothelin-converting enzyme
MIAAVDTIRGEVRRWWSAGEDEAYASRAARLVDQANSYEPLSGLRVNGELTLAENAGDVAGLSLALRAYRLSLNGRAAPVIDRFTAEQRFFLAWARMWRMKVRPDYVREWVTNFPYAPYEYRANGTVQNLSAFYEAFGITPGDRLFRPPAERVIIW